MIIKEGKSNVKYLLIVAVLATIVGGITYWQYSELQREEFGGEVAISEKIKKEIETVNWKMYRSEEYGFEIKYPEDWEIDKDISYDELIIAFDSIETIGRLHIEITESSKDLEEYVNDYNSKISGMWEKKIEILNSPAIQREEAVKSARHMIIATYFKKDNWIFRFSFFPMSVMSLDDISEEEQDLNNQILSTFKFLE